MKRCRVIAKQSGHAGHGHPHQHLITQDHSQGRRQTATNATLTRGKHQRQIARSGDEKKNQDGSHKSAVIGDAKHRKP